MKVYLVHHAEPMPPDPSSKRHLSEKGREQASRVGARLSAIGVAPERILHSGAQYVADTAMCVAQKLGAEDKVAAAAYPIRTGDSVEPFIAQIAEAEGDIIMCGHFEYLERTASRLVCGDESRSVIRFKPGNAGTVCIEGSGNDWIVSFAWRQEHPPE